MNYSLQFAQIPSLSLIAGMLALGEIWENEMVEMTILLRLLEEVRWYLDREDSRRWRLESFGKFSCKSFFKWLRHLPGSPPFLPFKLIWESKVPTNQRRVNTCDLLQRCRLGSSLCPHSCVLCKKAGESVDHVFLSCTFSWKLWSLLFNDIKFCWVAPKDCFSLFSE